MTIEIVARKPLGASLLMQSVVGEGVGVRGCGRTRFEVGPGGAIHKTCVVNDCRCVSKRFDWGFVNKALFREVRAQPLCLTFCSDNY